MKKICSFTVKADAKRAFTLAEVLITLVVLGIAIALTVPSILQKKPNESMAKFKKAYATTEKVVADLANDDTLYPDDGNTPTIVNAAGAEVNNVCANSNTASTTCQKPVLMYTAATPSTAHAGDTKFCNLFAEQVNTLGTINCAAGRTLPTAANPAGNPSFTTTDGIIWVINPVAGGITNTRANSAANTRGGAIEVLVDVNSGSRSPNVNNGLNPDQFRLWVDFDGKITIPSADVVGIEYLKQTSPSFRCKNAACN